MIQNYFQIRLLLLLSFNIFMMNSVIGFDVGNRCLNRMNRFALTFIPHRLSETNTMANTMITKNKLSSKTSFRNNYSTKLCMSTQSPSSLLNCPLKFETLPYRGVEVRLSSEMKHQSKNINDNDDERFLDELKQSLKFWKDENYTSAWIHLPSNRASLVESLTSSSSNSKEENLEVGIDNFELHHVNTTEQTIVLKQWLNVHTEDKIPPFATHQVGCAGFVVSDKNELLLVKEWQTARTNDGSTFQRIPSKQWKLPGGLCDIGESFGEGSCREVWEETGISCEFKSILCFWNRHGLTFGKSDIYVVCLLTPTSTELQQDMTEISQVKWISIKEFIQNDDEYDHPLIRHVFQHAYGLTTQNGDDDTIDWNKQIEPKNQIQEGAVQWPNRQPYPTYTASSTTTFDASTET